jgi:lysophospholipase L1-like esterase
MIGMMLLMLAGLEGAYRVQADLRHVAGRSIPATHPYAESAWYPAYLREYEATFGLRWKPYVYFRRGFHAGVYINVDSAGHRRTVPGPISASDTVRVFCFGGSTMFGSYLRDSATIPSVISRRLARLVAPSAAIEVTNYGESGYVFTQEMLELELQLRANNVPDVVVFYDGINDAAAAAQYGEAGVPQNEWNRAREFAFGRAIYGSETGVGSDARAAFAIGSAVAQRFQFFDRLREAVGSPAVPTRSSAALARDVAATYAANVDLIEALSKAYGFRVLYVWQPTLHTTTKHLTLFEQQLLRQIEEDAFNRRLREMHLAVGPLLDSAIHPRVGGRFVNEISLFANDTSSVFLDEIGHNTEKAIPTIVDAFVPQLLALVDSSRVAGRRSRTPD